MATPGALKMGRNGLRQFKMKVDDNLQLVCLTAGIDS
jgi:hypothetical protein